MINPGNYTGTYQSTHYNSDLELRKLALQLATKDQAGADKVLATAERYYAFLKGGVYK